MTIKITMFDAAALQQNFDTGGQTARRLEPPTISDAENICKQLLEILGDNALGVLLYGSLARDQANTNSDIDMLIIVKRYLDIVNFDIQQNIHDLGNYVVIHVVDLENLFASLLAKEPFLLGAIFEGKVLADNGILRALSVVAERNVIVPSKYTASFLFARSKQRLNIARSLYREAFLQVLSGATDTGFALAHLAGIIPKNVDEMLSLLQSSITTKSIANAIAEISSTDINTARFKDLTDKVENIFLSAENHAKS